MGVERSVFAATQFRFGRIGPLSDLTVKITCRPNVDTKVRVDNSQRKGYQVIHFWFNIRASGTFTGTNEMMNWKPCEKFVTPKKGLSVKLLLIVITLLMLSGCATTDAARTEAQGTLLGAVLGGVVGEIIGEKQGAIVGAYFGSILGNKWGQHVAGKKSEYANQELYLKDVIHASTVVTTDAIAYNKRIKGTITDLEKRKVELEASTAAHLNHRRQLKDFESGLKVASSETEKKIALVTREIEVQKKVIAMEQSTASSELIKVANIGVSDLEIQQRALNRALAQIKKIDDRRAY